MRYWRVIMGTLLVFAPLALFAAMAQYENPLGCELDTIPEFVKAVLTIVAKVGIPIGTMFLVWAGFLFITAQGDEGKLATAKKTFVWSCIGLGVLLGAWTFAVGVEGIIKDLGIGGSDTTTDGGCNDEGTGNEDYAIPEIPKHPMLEHETISPVTASPASPAKMKSAAVDSCEGPGDVAVVAPRILQEYWLSYSWQPETPFSLESFDPPVSGDSDTKDCLYDGGIDVLVNTAPENAESGAFYMDTSEGKKWKIVGEAEGSGSYYIPPQTYEQEFSGGATKIVEIHTHPGDGLIDSHDWSPPSTADIFSIAYMHSLFPEHNIEMGAADISSTVWKFDASLETPFIKLSRDGIHDGWEVFLRVAKGDSVEAKKFRKDFLTKYSPGLDAEQSQEWIDTVWEMLRLAHDGDYGEPLQVAADTYTQKIFNTPLGRFWNAWDACGSAEDEFVQYMLKLYNDYGVTITKEDHPYVPECMPF